MRATNIPQRCGLVNTLTKTRRIGIIGGMGPEATVLLMSKVIELTLADDDSDHVSMIVDNNTQIPSRIKAIIEKTGEDPSPVLIDTACRLEKCGAEALAMPCNTAHYYAPMIENAVEIPLINMVTLTVNQLTTLSTSIKRVGILASPAVYKTKIFDHAFSARNIETLYPSDQDKMLNAIRALKINSHDDIARQTMQSAALELNELGADCLLIACSELSIIANSVTINIPCFDTIDILARGIINFSGAKLRNEDQGSNDLRDALEQKSA